MSLLLLPVKPHTPSDNMSCSCNCTPCNCQPRPSICCTPTVESLTYTFENANLVGVGVFDNETDQLVQFRGIVSDSVALTVTLDAGNNVIVLDFDDTALVAAIPDATTTQRGILETATNAEAIAKAAADKILTPSNLAALGGSETFVGLLELATAAETIAGVSTTLAVHPAGLAAAASLYRTETFADAAARGAAVPDFIGQFGAQLDTDVPYLAFAAPAGSWKQILASGDSFVVSQGFPVTWSMPDSWTIDAGSTGDLTFADFALITFDNSPVVFTSSVQFDGNQNFTATARIFDAGVIVPANSVLTTSSTAGQLNSALLTTFLSTANTQTGWGTPSSTLARTTFATYAGQAISNPPTQAEVQTLDNAVVIVSQRLGALITDILARLLPAP